MNVYQSQGPLSAGMGIMNGWKVGRRTERTRRNEEEEDRKDGAVLVRFDLIPQSWNYLYLTGFARGWCGPLKFPCVDRSMSTTVFDLKVPDFLLFRLVPGENQDTPAAIGHEGRYGLSIDGKLCKGMVLSSCFTIFFYFKSREITCCLQTR